MKKEFGPIFGDCDIIVYGDYKEDGGKSHLGDDDSCYDSLGEQNPRELLFGKHEFTIDEYEVYKLE